MYSSKMNEFMCKSRRKMHNANWICIGLILLLLYLLCFEVKIEIDGDSYTLISMLIKD